MTRGIKKGLASLLAVILIFSSVSVIFASATENSSDLPIVYLTGRGYPISDKNGNQIYPSGIDEVEYTKSIVPELLKSLTSSMITRDWDSYCDIAYDKIATKFEQIQLDKNGEASDGSCINWTWSRDTLNHKKSGYGLFDYQFNYDWRIDPVALAAKLSDYIDDVLAVTGHSKVCLVGRCMGSSIVTAYLTEYGGDKVDNCVLYVPTIYGSTTVGALFANQASFSSDSIDRYVTYYFNGHNRFVDDDMLVNVLVTLVSLLNQTKALTLGTDLLDYIYEGVEDNLVPRLVRSIFFFPTYWAMVSDDYYEAAKECAFGDDADEYAGYIEKIDYYHYNVMNKAEDTLTTLRDNGMKISVIAKYGENLLPVEDRCDAQGDGRIDTSSLSLGAVCANIDEVLSDEYISAAKKNGTDKYISADKKVDASACLFPDSTWFIKDLNHANFPACVDDLIMYILKSDVQVTVWDNELYPQYMQYESDTASIRGLTAEDNDDGIWTRNIFQAYFRFVRAFLNFIIARINAIEIK